MPREVFAEELEAFLERLDSISAARVVANEAGEIERIYATTESTRDDGTVRRAITSALMSQYNLHVDGWRVQVAHLEAGGEIEPIPECHLVRLEETITERMTRVVVDLRYVRDEVSKTISGSAEAQPGQAHRMRTVALAVIDALRPLIERTGSRASLESVQSLPCASAHVVLAALSLASERASVLRVGSQVVAGSEAEAVVGAVLDAVRKPARGFVQPERPRADRQRQFEGLRRHYEQMIGSGGAAPEQAAAVQTPPAIDLDDAIPSLTEIRPEREGGATLMMRDEARSDTSSGPRPAPRPSMEDAFYRRLMTTAAPVHIRCRDGYEIPAAVVKDFGTYSLLIEANGIQELVFKHGILAIRPYGPIPPEPLPAG